MKNRSLRHFRSVSKPWGLLTILTLLFLQPVAVLADTQSWPWLSTDCDVDGQSDDGRLESQTIAVGQNTQVCVVPPSYQNGRTIQSLTVALMSVRLRPPDAWAPPGHFTVGTP